MIMDVTLWAETGIQIAGVLFLAPLVEGILEALKARLESRRGPSIFQPYYDLKKYLSKENLFSAQSSLFFIFAPFVTFSIYLTISFVIPVVLPFPVFLTPVVDFLGGAILFTFASVIQIIAAIRSGDNFSAMGASRIATFSAFAEPTLITVFFAVAIISNSNNPYLTESLLVSDRSLYLSLTHILATIAFFMLLLFETGRLPVESSGMMELGIIDEAKSFEYSGRSLFLMKYSSLMKQYLLGSVFLNVFIMPWFMLNGLNGALLDIPIMLGKWIVLILAIVIIEESFAKLRLFKIQEFLTVSFAMAILAVTSFVAGGII